MFPFTSVLVPLDLSRDADRALPVAAALARGLGVPLDVVMVGSRGVSTRRDDQQARQHAGVVGVEVDDVLVRYDDDVAGGVLAEAAASGALLCCATHAHGGLADLFFRSVSGQLVRRTHTPLVLVGPGVTVDPPPRFLDVLACIDGTPAAAAVAVTALACARRLDVKAHVAQVVPDAAADDIELTIEAGDVAVAWDVIHDPDPARGILTVADHLGDPLLIMGTHDHTPDGPHPALGHVTHAVVHASPFPVLVIPRSEA